MKHLKYITLFIFIIIIASCSDNTNENNETIVPKPMLPKKELRGVWIATVWGLDWPMEDYNSSTQKQKYIDYLELFAQKNINAVFFQIRGMADTFYDSEYEPWSKYITGVTGKEPDYDVLKFLIDEAHKRGIQFHAWLNPYRISTRASSTSSFPNLDPKIPEKLVKDYSKIRIYNPALPEVQSRIVNIVKEIITKYDVDGIHLDDYFYPSLESAEKMNDEEEYETYGKDKFTDIADFRRNNVNVVVQNIQKAIINTRPDVVFSISPAANNDNNYNNLYADVIKWTQEGWVDLIIPQLYFATGTTENSFNQRLSWWSQYTYNSHLMIGYGIYKFGDPNAGEKFQTPNDLRNQFELANTKDKVKGSILYSAKYLVENKIGITNLLTDIYKNKVIPPYLGREEVQKPNAPVLALNGSKLSWDNVNAAYYAIYKDNGDGKIATLIGTTKETTFNATTKGIYYVTALNKKHAESELSNSVIY